MLDDAQPGPVTDPTRGPPLGDGLELLFDQLERAGLKPSTRDRTNATLLVADLVARGAVTKLGDLRPYLAPLLARSVADRERFFQAFDLISPPPPQPDSERRPTERETPAAGAWKLPSLSLRAKLAGLAALTLLTLLGYWWWPREQLPELKPLPDVAPISTPRPAPAPAAVAAPPPPSANDYLNRIAKAAERFEGAPTIAEIAPALAKSATSPALSSDGYALRLAELSGLPRTWPVALYGADPRDGEIGKDGRVWATLALALARIEVPGREPTFGELLAEANKSLAAQKDVLPVYHLLTRTEDIWQPRITAKDKPTVIDIIQKRFHRNVAKRSDAPLPGERLDIQTVERALAISADPSIRRAYPDAPWIPVTRTSGVPWWVPWLAAIVPLALAALWFANSLALRKAYLRRRPPDLPPLHIDLVSEAATRVRIAAGLFHDIAKRLRVRSMRPTGRLDLSSSIAATLAAGGEMLKPVYEMARHTAEYLVLIERRSAGDQDAKRLRDLVGRIEAQVPLTVFYYRSDTARLEPEGGGRAIPIEQAQAAYPEHRLLILGSGADFLDAATLKPHTAAEKLTHWPSRALLTPLALAEWGREEFALAHALQMPIGRATPEGLLALADLLGLDGSEPESLVDPSGDGLARPLPELLRIRPQRFLYNTPPSGTTVPQIVQDLRNFLDRPGFEWLCALAVYPAVQWDLTLYLGVTLPERAGDETGAPLYTEDRVAALTQLPWLREGIMPNWLRTALIACLTKERAAEVRKALLSLIDAAKLSGADPRRDETVKLRIGQEAMKDKLEPEELLEDEVLLDFLAKGRIEDFALPSSWLDKILQRFGLLDRFGIPEVAAGAVALVYAIAAWWLAPKPDDGALVTGAWLPLGVLATTALLILAAANWRTSYYYARRFVIWLAPYMLFALLVSIGGRRVLHDTGFLQALSELVQDWPDLARNSIWYLPGLVFLVAMFAVARATCRALGLSVWRYTGGAARRALKFAGSALGAYLVVLAIVDGAFSIQGQASDNALFIILTLLVFAGLIAHRFLPERIKPRPVKKGAAPAVPWGVRNAAAALLPVVLAVLAASYVSGASQRLPDMPGGATAIAEAPGGRYLAIGGGDGRVNVIDIATGEPKLVKTVPPSGTAVSSLAIRAERDLDPASPVTLAVASADGRLALYDALWADPKRLPGALADVRSEGSRLHVALLQGARPLVAAESADGKTRLIAEGGASEVKAGKHDVAVTALAAADKDRAAVATLDGQVRLVTLAVTEGAPGSASTIADNAPQFPKAEHGARRIVYAGHLSKPQLIATYADGNVLKALLSDAGIDAEGATLAMNETLRLGTPPKWEPKAVPIAVQPTEAEQLSVPCVNAMLISSAVARRTDVDAWAAAKAEFWSLYRGDIKIVEAYEKRFRADGTSSVEAAMVRFGRLLMEAGESPKLPIGGLEEAAAEISTACTGFVKGAQQAKLNTEEGIKQITPDISRPQAERATPDRRVALLIGNSNYQYAPKLATPANDARLIADALMKIGFTVYWQTDAGPASIRSALDEFERKYAGAEIGLFYYAGHGLQFEGENYIVPVYARLASSADIATELISPAEIKQTMERTAKTRVILLDAARDNPFAAEIDTTRRLQTRGLARVDAGPDTVIGYSAAPGNIALDGYGSNSPYAEALAREIAVPGLTIEEVLRNVSRSVMKETDGKQTPWVTSTLTADLILNPLPDTVEQQLEPPERAGKPKAQCAFSRNLAGETGSSAAAQSDWPWMAALVLDEQTIPFCGATLIRPRIALTVAQCVADTTPDRLKVFAGSTELRADPDLKYTVKRKAIHPAYASGANRRNDIALLVLDRDWTGPVAPLAEPGFKNGGTLVAAAGFSTGTEGGGVGNTLREVRVPLVPRDKCEASYPGRLDERSLCAGLDEGGADTCQGDSGGPLVGIDENGCTYQIGIISWGDGCGRPRMYGVYEDVSKHSAWINETIADIENDLKRADDTKQAPLTQETAKPYSEVKIFFGTDRASVPADTGPQFGSERSRQLTFGQATVTVPRKKVTGEIARPSFLDRIIRAEDPSKHFTVRETRLIAGEEFNTAALLAGALKGQSLLYVHGYNVSFEDALYRAAQIAHDIRFDGAIYLYSWPSNGSVTGYLYDRDSSSASAQYLRTFLGTIATGSQGVNIVADGMGATPVMNALKDVAAAGNPPQLGEIALVNPDIDRDLFENLVAQLRSSLRDAGMTLYVDQSDLALAAARQISGGVPRAGDTGPDGPAVIAPGIDTIVIERQSQVLAPLNTNLFADLSRLISTGIRPPDKRTPGMQSVATARGTFWRLPADAADSGAQKTAPTPDAPEDYRLKKSDIPPGRDDTAAPTFDPDKQAKFTDRLPQEPADQLPLQKQDRLAPAADGDTLLAQGKVQEALVVFRENLANARRLVEGEPDNLGWQRDLLSSQERVGHALVAQGNLEEALIAYRESLAIAERLVEVDPNDAERQGELWVANANVGDVLLAQGNIEEAMETNSRGLALAARFAGADPANAQWQIKLWASHTRVGEVLTAQANIPEALQAYREGLAIAERGASADPSNARWKNMHWESLNYVGDRLADQDKIPEALQSYRKGLALAESRAFNESGDIRVQTHVSDSYERIGNVLSKQAELSEARQSYETSLAILQRLAANDPDNPEWARAVARVKAKVDKLVDFGRTE